MDVACVEVRFRFEFNMIVPCPRPIIKTFLDEVGGEKPDGVYQMQLKSHANYGKFSELDFSSHT